MKKHLPSKCLLAFVMLLSSITSYAQTDSLSKNIEDISLEELMNVKIVSASKKEESQFDAPLSASSISREEIKKAGATSIMEALRLLPGLFVTESTNGNYNVSIRGFSNMPAGTSLNAAANSITLVMIDNRPVYNYFNGGTFWETLPVDLNDVEKIEVVRGPAAAVYGPNAAAGVINIITRRPQKEGLYTVANVQGGTPNQIISNASVGYKLKKLDFIVSGNQQFRQRTQSDYYSWVTGKNTSADSIQTSFPTGAVLTDTSGKPNASQRYPNRNTSMNKWGYNGFLNYNISEKSIVSLAFGGEQAFVQKAFIENLATPLSSAFSNSQYANLKAKINRFSGQVSYLKGIQDEAVGFIGYKYNFNTLDANAEYDIVYKGLSIKPGVFYRRADYNDTKYAHVDTKQGFLGGNRILANYAGSIRTELNASKKIKITAAGRLDKYNAPTKAYFSYQAGANYKLNEKNLLRVVVSKAYKGPNMYDTYANNNIFIGNLATQVAPGVTLPLPYYAHVQGNPSLLMQSISMVEVGYRVKATDNLYFDLEVFHQTTQNFSYLVGQPTVVSPLGIVTINQSVQNISMKATQNGATLSANFVLKKFQFKPFVTYQVTNNNNYPLYRNSVSADSVHNITVTQNMKDQGTPNVYGGFYANLQATSRLNFNLNSYIMSNYTYLNLENSFDPTKGNVAVFGKVILNAKISYKFFNRLDLFVNVRNLTNSRSFEFAHTDITKATFLVGGSFEF
ncbi:MAG TPA: TonB-dependent receptor [Cytophagaceae bacterium]|jgi:iron complex outermembrane receptor protein|nr:TonB-dependent receptor [Cytophagaceae bacterium]